MNEEEIFHKALALDSAERAMFLDRACADDPVIRASVEGLLRANIGASAFLDRPVGILAEVGEPICTERPGIAVGQYKLLEQIGEGGFGVVFMAEQQQPVRRKVALKVLRPGMDSRQVVARFEAERQALAIMDHPNIARVFDGGTTPSGRPFFVMELVKGVPITDYCDRGLLSPRQRLELFVPVCLAMQHAHQKGIVHRDLKPSNVLVTMHDATPVVKVIDFGIAKAIGQELTDKTVFTGFAQLIGTPMYMSPEQAGQNGLDIDTRSDIYSLGVMLYELLTGTTPFDGDRLKNGSVDDLRRIIREEEPDRPSTRVSTLGLAASTISANRGSDPRRLSVLFRGELDWIVMKALEKDRDRRYQTTSDLAADVRRYLADEPVQACPPSAAYRFHKFARRNKVALGVTGGVLLLALGTATVLAVSNEAIENKRRETARALAAETDAREDLQKVVARERRNYYGYAFELARRDWLAGNIEEARRRLEDCPIELRDREWQSLHRACNAELLRIDLGNRSAQKLCYSPDGKSLAAFIPNGSCIVAWDSATGREKARLPTAGQIAGLTFSPDGEELIWVSDGYQQSPTKTLLGQPAIPSPQGFEAVVWNIAGRRRVAGFNRKDSRGMAVLSADGRRVLLVAKNPGSLTFDPPESASVYDTRSGQQLFALGALNQYVGAAVILPSGRVLTAFPREHVIRVWDVTGQVAGELDIAGFSRVILSPDGQRVAVVIPGVPAELKVLDSQALQEFMVIRLASGVGALAFSHNGRRLASVNGNAVTVWDVGTRRELLTFRGHKNRIWDLAFSPDDNRLAAVEQTVRIWDVSQLDTSGK